MKFRAALLYAVGLRAVAGSNPEIADNSLGITSRACADNYCLDKDSLDLWLAVEWECHEDDVLIGDGSGPPDATDSGEIQQAPSRRRRANRRHLASIESIAALTTFQRDAASSSSRARTRTRTRRRRLDSSSAVGVFDSVVQSLLKLTVSRILTALVTSALGVVGILIGYRVGRSSVLQGAAKRSEKEIGTVSGAIARSSSESGSDGSVGNLHRRRDWGDAGSPNERQRLHTPGRSSDARRPTGRTSTNTNTSSNRTAVDDDDDDDDDDEDDSLEDVSFHAHIDTRGKLHSLLNPSPPLPSAAGADSPSFPLPRRL